MATAIKASPAPCAPPVSGIRYCVSCLAIYRQDFTRCPLDGGQLVVGASDPWIGSTVGDHYVIDGLVGEGAMGRVYRAHHKDIADHLYAIKVLIGDLAATPQMRARFQQEAEHASKLAHPNVVGVIDYGATSHGVNYIVMDLVQGPSLGAILQQGPMDPDRVIKLARQLCEGLDHAHGRGMIHRDFKPDNILVVGEGDLEVARIADFGLALSLDTQVRLTTTGIVCTPAYAAPEQLRGQAIDQRVDLYALGTTMYEMLSGGHLPFAGDLDTSVRNKLMNDAPSVLLIAPNVPPSLVSIVGRLLSSDPTRRPRSARAVMRALDGALSAPRAEMLTDQTRPMRRQTAANQLIDASDSNGLPNKAASKSPSETNQPARSGSHIDLRPRQPFRRTLLQLFAVGITFGGVLAFVGLRDPKDVKAALSEPAKLPAVVEIMPQEQNSSTFAAHQPNSAQASAPGASRKPVEYTIAKKKLQKQHKRANRVVRQQTVSPQRAGVLAANFDEAAEQTSAQSIAYRHGSISRQLQRLDEALGRENTDDLWSAFRTIEISDAIASPDARVVAAATLATIQEAIVDRTP